MNELANEFRLGLIRFSYWLLRALFDHDSRISWESSCFLPVSSPWQLLIQFFRMGRLMAVLATPPTKRPQRIRLCELFIKLRREGFHSPCCES